MGLAEPPLPALDRNGPRQTSTGKNLSTIDLANLNYNYKILYYNILHYTTFHHYTPLQQHYTPLHFIPTTIHDITNHKQH